MVTSHSFSKSLAESALIQWLFGNHKFVAGDWYTRKQKEQNAIFSWLVQEKQGFVQEKHEVKCRKLCLADLSHAGIPKIHTPPTSSSALRSLLGLSHSPHTWGHNLPSDSSSPPSTFPKPTSCNLSDTYFHKHHTSGLFQSKVPYLGQYLYLY